MKEQTVFTRTEMRQLAREIGATHGARLARILNDARDATLHEELYEVCDSEHASCSDACPVFLLNGHKVPMQHGNCRCFKNGEKMLKFIRSKRA